MTPEELQDFASENKLDVRPMSQGRGGRDNHLRLMDTFGEYIVDVYFRSTRAGTYKKTNKIFIFKNHQWSVIQNKEELKNKIYEHK